MKLLIVTLFFLTTAFAEVKLPRAATGFELGVSRLAGKGEAVTGTSWMYRFEMQPDRVITFFGEAGKAQGKESDVRIEQTSFGGGVEVDLLPVIGARVGVATTIAEVSTDARNVRERELGPFAGLCVNYYLGVFKLGTSATVLRTETVHSTSLRLFGLVEF